MGFTKKMPSFGSNKSNTNTNNTTQNVKNNIDTNEATEQQATLDKQDMCDNISQATGKTESNNPIEDNNKDYDKLNKTIETLQQNIQDLTKKNKTLETKLMYLASEYENTKKRSAKELEDALKFSIAKFANDAVKIFDVLITAIDNTTEEKNDKSFYDGVKMTIGDFNSLFAKLNIEKIDPKEGDMFDHNLHEAISRAPSDLDVGAIVKVIRCGYSLHGRLLRPAMVVVSAGK